jgi:tRNA(Ser,Leu) C12 N-acetylase TAN1
MKRIKAKLSLGRKRAAKRIASQEKLMMRSRRKAREFILKRLTKDIPKSELTFARRQELEKRLDKMKGRIEKIAKRMLPKVRKAELDKKRGGGKKD